MYRNYQFINEQANDALVLALLTEPTNSPIFTGYPDALVEIFQPLPRSLSHRLHNFGWQCILKSFEMDGLKGFAVTHRMPQNDFLGYSHGIEPRDFESRKFDHDGEEWCVFEILQNQPYPVTNPGRIDRTYYCAPKAQIGE